MLEFACGQEGVILSNRQPFPKPPPHFRTEAASIMKEKK
jgi:hypothetical protein